ncbi:MAG TPA: HEAT repeat domain-containing protein [Pyrinomonadaceae bacterium]|jgi:hypothetical protein
MNFQELSPYDLGLTGSPDALPYLIGYLKNGASNEKRLAASAVRKLIPYCKEACEGAVPALLSCLEDPAPQVRQYAIKTLAELDLPEEAIERLRNVSDSDEKEYNRAFAGEILKRRRSSPGHEASAIQAGSPDTTIASLEKELSQESEDFSFRARFPAVHRTIDGHLVRSRAEIIIDNWLYAAGVVHAYERMVPVKENLYCDFYVPAGDVYIEYWGLEADPLYAERMRSKKEIYQRYGLRLIELRDSHISQLDDYLPKFLLKFSVRVHR